MNHDFDLPDAHMTLEAYRALYEKWKGIRDDAAAKDDADTASEVGMDMIRLKMLCESFELEAVADFGPDVASSSAQPIAPVTVNGEQRHQH